MNQNAKFTLDQKLKALEIAVKIAPHRKYSNTDEGSIDADGIGTNTYAQEVGTYLALYMDTAMVILKEMDSL